MASGVHGRMRVSTCKSARKVPRWRPYAISEARRSEVKYFLKTLCLLSLLLCAVLAMAQTETGQITGTIRDTSGAVVAGAKITVKSATTGLTRTATTNAVGLYTIPSLRPDTYDVTIQSPGFQPAVRRVQLAVGATADVSPQMSVAAASTTVEVTESSAAVAVNTESQTLSDVVTAKQLSELPTSPTRNPYALVATAGNVSEDTNSGRGAGFSINGQRSASTSILLDGSENVDEFTASVGQTVPLDSVQEFSVLTNNYTAEYGRASGGVVNVVTKSGSNEFHGSAYEFNRVSALSANTYQNDATDTPKGIFTRNDFGFSVGGPIKKDKLFFFDNLEWIRVRSNAPVTYTIIDPSSYSALAPASQQFFSAYGKMAPGVKTVGTVACGTLTCDTVTFPVPTDAGGGSPQNTWMEVARIDYNISDRTTLFGRYASYKELDFPGTVNSSPYDGYSTGQSNYDQNISLNLNHVFTANLVNTVKVTYNRINGPVQGLGVAPVGPTLYTSSSIPAVGGFPLVFPGYSETTPGNAIPFGGPQNLYQIYDDVSWTHGKHQFKFGGQYIHIRDNRTFGAYENAVEYLGTSLSSGLANLVAGNLYQFQGAVYPQGMYPCPKDASGNTLVSANCTLQLPVTEPSFERNYHYNDLAFYGQDSWKITPRLMLNAGLRWEYYGVQHNADTALDSNFVLGSGSTIFDQIRNGSVQLASDGGVFWKPVYSNFGPRVGFAYDVFGDGTTSLRGGYSIGYERNFGNVTYNAIQNPPNYAVVSLTAGTDVASMPVYTDNAGPLAGTGTKPLPAVSQRAINQDMKTAYAETWNLTLERQLGKTTMVSVGYAGSHGVHLYDISNINPAGGGSLYLGDIRASNRLNYQYSNINYRSDNGFSHYNALNLGFRTSNLRNSGVSLNANYTWAHSLDNLSSTFSEIYGGQSGVYYLGYLDGFNPKLDYGNSDYDIRQRFVLSGSWDIPWGKHLGKSYLREALGGWGIGSILNVRSGMPFSVFDCSNFNGTSCPMYVPGQAITSSGTPVAAGSSYSANLFNYITLPNTGGLANGLGNALGMPVCTGLYHTGCTYTADGSAYPDRNQFVAPGFWNADMNFYKNFKLTERFQLQFRGEFYNIFNHHNQYVTGLNLDASSLVDVNGNPSPYLQTEKGGVYGYAGQPSDERRNIQFGLRLTF